MTIWTETITRGERAGYLARPADARAGVLLLPSVHGVDQYAKAYAHALAEAGLATVIWEPFPGHRRPKPRATRGAACDADRRDVPARDELVARPHGERAGADENRHRRFLSRRPLRLAALRADERIAACVSYYPTIETPPLPGRTRTSSRSRESIPCPVHMIRAGKDHLTSDDVFQRLQANLQSRVGADDHPALPAGRSRLHAAHRRNRTRPPSISRRRNDRVFESGVGCLAIAHHLRHPEVPERSEGLEGRRPRCCSTGAVHPSRLASLAPQDDGVRLERWLKSRITALAASTISGGIA